MPKTLPQKLADEEYIRYFGQRQRSSLKQVGLHDNNGLFAPACLAHGNDFSRLRLRSLAPDQRWSFCGPYPTTIKNTATDAEKKTKGPT